MTCTVELLHIAPLFALIFAYVSNYSLRARSAFSAVASIVGLLGGAHMHVEHAVPYVIFDPCVVYGVALVVSVFFLLKNTFQSKLAK